MMYMWLFDLWRNIRARFWRIMPHKPRLLWDDGDGDDWCKFCERWENE